MNRITNRKKKSYSLQPNFKQNKTQKRIDKRNHIPIRIHKHKHKKMNGTTKSASSFNHCVQIVTRQYPVDTYFDLFLYFGSHKIIRQNERKKIKRELKSPRKTIHSFQFSPRSHTVPKSMVCVLLLFCVLLRFISFCACFSFFIQCSVFSPKIRPIEQYIRTQRIVEKKKRTTTHIRPN